MTRVGIWVPAPSLRLKIKGKREEVRIRSPRKDRVSHPPGARSESKPKPEQTRDKIQRSEPESHQRMNGSVLVWSSHSHVHLGTTRMPDTGRRAKSTEGDKTHSLNSRSSPSWGERSRCKKMWFRCHETNANLDPGEPRMEALYTVLKHLHLLLVGNK